MYDVHYGFSASPFQLTPDPRFYFESATHRKALSYLGYGLAQGEGFIVITGEIGAGKTMLVRHLLATVDLGRLTAASIVTTQLSGGDLIGMVANAFGLIAESDKTRNLTALEAFLHAEARAGRRCLLVVDEAQNLPVMAVEELRMLSNFQLGGQALLQIFLLGQPEFRDLLQRPELEQLRQRVIASHHLVGMEADEIEPYVVHRLAKVGWSGTPTIAPGAYQAVMAATGGVPRKVNTLMSRILLAGAVEGVTAVDASLVTAVIADAAADESVQAVVSERPFERVQTRTVESARTLPTADDSRLLDALNRIAALEGQAKDQETTLRRVLSLLIDWVEQDSEGVRQAAAGRAA